MRSLLIEDSAELRKKEDKMCYKYEKIKPKIFTEENQKLFLGIREHVKRTLAISGAITMIKATILPKGVGGADSWTQMACVDRLVELGEIREICQNQSVFDQERIFVLVEKTA